MKPTSTNSVESGRSDTQGEHRTSNPLLTYLRACAELADAGGGNDDGLAYVLPSRLREVSDEIERLTAELADAQKFSEYRRRVANDMQAERDQMKRERDTLQRAEHVRALEAVEYEEKIKGLRAALARIADRKDGLDDRTSVDFAKDTLAGYNHADSSPMAGHSHAEVNRQPVETDDAPELTEADFARAVFKIGGRVVSREEWAEAARAALNGEGSHHGSG